MNALIELLRPDRTGGYASMVRTTRQIPC